MIRLNSLIKHTKPWKEKLCFFGELPPWCPVMDTLLNTTMYHDLHLIDSSTEMLTSSTDSFKVLHCAFEIILAGHTLLVRVAKVLNGLQKQFVPVWTDFSRLSSHQQMLLVDWVTFRNQSCSNPHIQSYFIDWRFANSWTLDLFVHYPRGSHTFSNLDCECLKWCIQHGQEQYNGLSVFSQNVFFIIVIYFVTTL